MLHNALTPAELSLANCRRRKLLTAILEFVRPVDMCSVNDMESPMAKHITKRIFGGQILYLCLMRVIRTPSVLNSTSTASLPTGHFVRDTLAPAAVKGYF